MEITISTPGKVHLLGEHAVVYGKPALLTTVDKRCQVKLTARPDSAIEIFSKNINRKLRLSLDDILLKIEEAEKSWQRYKETNDLAILKSITTGELDYSILAVGQTLRYYRQRPSSGFRLSINSAIPIGAGLGSSAAIAVAVTAAVTLFLGQPLDKDVINNIAFIIEQKKHGFPSGGDNSTICFGGLIWFRKESSELKIIKPLPFALPDNLSKNFILINTGTPAESTGEMVSYVKSLYQEKKALVEQFLKDQEELTRGLLAVIKKSEEDRLIEIIKRGEKNLEKIRVVSSFAQNLIREIEKCGGAAKICGGGGMAKNVGVVLSYHQTPEKIKDLVKPYKLECFGIRLGVEGLKQE